MGQHIRTGSTHDLPTSPAISEMIVFMKQIWTKHTPPLYEVFRQSAITKMTVGSVGSFHSFCETCVL